MNPYENEIHQELLETYQHIYKPLQLTGSVPEKEPESDEYVAYNFVLNGLTIKFRLAKITHKK